MTAIAELIATGTKHADDSQLRHIATHGRIHQIDFRMEKPAVLVPSKILFGAIQDRRLCLKKPIPVELSESLGVITAHCGDLDEFGQGSVVSEALEDFGKTICEMFFALQDREHQLSLDLITLQKRLAEYIQLRALHENT
jgi:hypothetical protein